MRISFVFSLLLLAVIVPRAAAQIERVDPTAELRRAGTFVDTVRVELATQAELDRWLSRQDGGDWFLFAETRDRDIRFDDALPAEWLIRQPAERAVLRGRAQPGEHYIWQAWVYAPERELENITLEFSDLTNENGQRKIAAEALQCYNLGGVDKDGNTFIKRVDVPAGTLQALWIGADIPLDAQGAYTGTVVVRPGNALPQTMTVTLEVGGDPLPDGGVHDAWRKSRAKWLNSRIGQGSEPTAPYTPLVRDERTLRYLGGRVELSADGFPARIVTQYDRSNQLDPSVRNEILARPVKLTLESGKGTELLQLSGLRFLEQTDTRIRWNTLFQNGDFDIVCLGAMCFDGSIEYRVKVKAKRDTDIRQLRVEFPFTEYAAEYLMGLGHKGGKRPAERIDWTWDTTRFQDQIWLGNVNAGLNIQLKGGNYVRPLGNIYYHFGRLRHPDSWGAGRANGVRIEPREGEVTVIAFGGERRMEAGETLEYNFDLMVTPVKPIDLAHHFVERFYHLNADVSAGFIPTGLEYGATHINIHHKADIYPFLNYPMEDAVAPDLKRFIEQAHEEGLGVRLYYTCRELSVKTPEFWMLRSMGDEFLADGPGNEARTAIHSDGPKPWLLDNLRKNYIPGWYAGFEEGRFKGELDIAVIATPESRWSNYWLEGLDWMVKELNIDGIYIDDSSLDGGTLRRARRILDADGRRRLVDMHTWNHMNEYAGWANSLQLYFTLLPYIDRLWIGEMFKADNPVDFWLTEMSGIPFGLMSETLDAHNTFRGMVFGMLPRLPWSGNPAPMWRLLDEFGMSEARMYGYWDDRNPVCTGNDKVFATTYLRGDRALVVIANWNDDSSETFSLDIDAQRLGFTPGRIALPEIEELQNASAVDLQSGRNEIPAQGGLILMLEK